MISFEPLEQLLTMDFAQLRANKGTATDEAMDFFVSKLNQFFEQVNHTKPTPEDIIQFDLIMQTMLTKINEVEFSYFKQKGKIDYPDETDEIIESIATHNIIENYKILPTRMQYWSRRDGWGDTIHNPRAHIAAVKGLEAWPNKPASTYKISAKDASHFFSAASAGDAGFDSDCSSDETASPPSTKKS